MVAWWPSGLMLLPSPLGYFALRQVFPRSNGVHLLAPHYLSSSICHSPRHLQRHFHLPSPQRIAASALYEEIWIMMDL